MSESYEQFNVNIVEKHNAIEQHQQEYLHTEKSHILSSLGISNPEVLFSLEEAQEKFSAAAEAAWGSTASIELQP